MVSGQPSLFNHDQHNIEVLYCALIAQGYYYIERERVFVSIEVRRHGIKVWRDKWIEVAVLYETDTPGVFNYMPHRGDILRNLYYELAFHGTKYKIAYGRTYEQCGQCNRKLSLDRSKHYGIGSECEGKHPEVINEVDESNGRLSWEELQSAKSS